jgi:anhydro-N-acetylmuramic acid kinase
MAVESTLAYGIDPDWLEAAAFAWLAKQAIVGRSGNIPEITGARYPVILGRL